jgi:hypothetical protein
MNKVISTLPKPTVVGILVKPQAYDEVCRRLRKVEEVSRNPLIRNYSVPVEVVTHPQYQLDQAMLFSSRESMRKFLEMLDESSRLYGPAVRPGAPEGAAADGGETPHDPMDDLQRATPEEGSDVP